MMTSDGIICRITKNEIGMWKVTAHQGDKSVTIAIKESEHDAKQLAFAMHALGKVGAIEFEGGLIFL